MKLTRRFFTSLPFAALLSRTHAGTALLAAAPPPAAPIALPFKPVVLSCTFTGMTEKEKRFYESRGLIKFVEEPKVKKIIRTGENSFRFVLDFPSVV